jgi:hypothetical protein
MSAGISEEHGTSIFRVEESDMHENSMKQAVIRPLLLLRNFGCENVTSKQFL